MKCHRSACIEGIPDVLKEMCNAETAPAEAKVLAIATDWWMVNALVVITSPFQQSHCQTDKYVQTHLASQQNQTPIQLNIEASETAKMALQLIYT